MPFGRVLSCICSVPESHVSVCIFDGHVHLDLRVCTAHGPLQRSAAMQGARREQQSITKIACWNRSVINEDDRSFTGQDTSLLPVMEVSAMRFPPLDPRSKWNIDVHAAYHSLIAASPRGSNEGGLESRESSPIGSVSSADSLLWVTSTSSGVVGVHKPQRFD